MLRKINLPVLVTLMCVLLIGVLGLVYLNRGYLNHLFFKKSTVDTTEIQITRTDYSQVARKTLDWIDTQRNENGWYILERGCDVTTKTCDTVWDNSDGNKDGLIATWARFNFYEQTKDPKDLEIVKSDINKFYEKYPDGVDNALWICKITYDMWQSNEFDQETKDKLEKICFNAQFPTPEEVKVYWENGVKMKKLENLLAYNTVQNWKDWENYTLYLRGFDANFGYTSDLISRYLWKNEAKYLTEAKKYLEVEMDLYKSKVGVSEPSEFKYPENICLLGLSVLKLYQVDNDEKNLSFAEEIYDVNLNNGENKNDFITTICGLFGKELYQETKNKDYLKILEINNKVLESLKVDGNNMSILDDGGFFRSDGKKLFSYYKSVAENGLLVELFRN